MSTKGNWWNEHIYSQGKGAMFGYVRGILYHDEIDMGDFGGWYETTEGELFIRPEIEKLFKIQGEMYWKYGRPEREIDEYKNGYDPDRD